MQRLPHGVPRPPFPEASMGLCAMGRMQALPALLVAARAPAVSSLLRRHVWVKCVGCRLLSESPRNARWRLSWVSCAAVTWPGPGA